MEGGTRVLLASFGSAGDILPLVPIADELRKRGAQVQAVAPRSSGLYLRMAGIQTLGLGRGEELRVFGDAAMYSLRFDGWSSWRRTIRDYVAPNLADDVATLVDHLKTYRPDVVVCLSFAVSARLAAMLCDVPLVNLSIYPQHERLSDSSRAFCRELVRAAVGLLGRRADPDEIWGTPADALLHDRQLLQPAVLGDRAVGFPSWDEVPARAEDVTDFEAWLDDTAEAPRLIVTLGSFIGSAAHETWAAIAEEVGHREVDAAFVGVGRAGTDEILERAPRVACFGFVPLTRHTARVTAVIHHGGVGTTFAALRSGIPSLVLPQAFDQGYNARLVAARGVGIDGRCKGLASSLDDLFAPELSKQTRAVADNLVPVERCVATVADLVLQTSNQS